MAVFTGTKTQEDIKKNEENKKKKIEEKKNSVSNKDIYSEPTYEEAKAKYGQGVGNNKYFMSKEAWEKDKAEQSKQETPKKEQSLVANQFGDKKGKTWNDVLTENENDPEKIKNWLNNTPDYKAGELTKKGMAEFGYTMGEDGKWVPKPKTETKTTTDDALTGVAGITSEDPKAKGFVDGVTNKDGSVNEQKALTAMSQYEQKLVEMGAGSFDKDGKFVFKDTTKNGWEDWATMLSVGASVIGIAMGVPIMPINFRKITNKDEKDTKIREFQKQYADIMAGNAAKVEDVKSSVEAGKLAKANEEDLKAYSKYKEDVGAYEAKSTIDTDSEKELISAQLQARLEEIRTQQLNNEKTLALENKYSQEMTKLSSELAKSSAKELTSYSNTGWIIDYIKELKAQGLENRDVALAVAGLGAKTPTQKALENAESVVGMVTDVADSASKFVPGLGKKDK